MTEPEPPTALDVQQHLTAVRGNPSLARRMLQHLRALGRHHPDLIGPVEEVARSDEPPAPETPVEPAPEPSTDPPATRAKKATG
jgi:hypothetical protein